MLLCYSLRYGYHTISYDGDHVTLHRMKPNPYHDAYTAQRPGPHANPKQRARNRTVNNNAIRKQSHAKTHTPDKQDEQRTRNRILNLSIIPKKSPNVSGKKITAENICKGWDFTLAPPHHHWHPPHANTHTHTRIRYNTAL